jgi:hypothetical protein
LRAAERRLATAESCASGWAGKALIDIPGSSRWFECTYVTHSGAAKLRDLGVAAGTLESFGAVSERTVRRMRLEHIWGLLRPRLESSKRVPNSANESIPIAPGPATFQQTLQCQRWRITAG